MKLFRIILLVALPLMALCQGKNYEPKWESLESRPLPAWFEDAKFGIFIHWGPYSVPAWAPKGVYSEWYQYWLETRKVFGNFNPKPSAVYDYHVNKFGKDFSYYNFGGLFRAEDFKPEEWVKLFRDAGARYIVLTSKHHDGFALWPSREADRTWGFPWNSLSSGPKRDLIGELEKEIRKTDIKFGLYYSLYEWYNPLWKTNKEKYVNEHYLPQVKDLVTTYRPDILWADGDWEMTADEWKSPELLAWLYNDSPVKDRIIVNDRWGSDVRRKHGGYLTTEFDASRKLPRPWEGNRGIGFSFGYNRNEDVWDYNSAQTLILLMVDIVCHGGNLLLDIGPDASGKIPPIMQERLLQIGEWLGINGEAVYGTRQWKYPVQWSKGKIMEGDEYKKANNLRYLGGDFILKQTVNPDPGMAVKEMFFTRKGNNVYVVLPQLTARSITINDMTPSPGTGVTLLGTNLDLKWEKTENGMVINAPVLSIYEIPYQYAYVLKITDVF